MSGRGCPIGCIQRPSEGLKRIRFARAEKMIRIQCDPTIEWDSTIRRDPTIGRDPIIGCTERPREKLNWIRLGGIAKDNQDSLVETAPVLQLR